MPNIENVGTAKQADVAREADTLTKLDTFNIASIYVIVLCDMVFQSSSFIVFVQGTSLLWPFHIWSLSSTDQGFLNHNWLPTIFFMKPAVSSTCIFEECKAFDNSVTIFCKRAFWMIPHGLEIATPGKWSTSKIVKNFTGANLCLLQSQKFFVLY